MKMKKSLTLILIIILIIAFGSCTVVNEYESGIDVASTALPCVLELTSRFQASTSYATGFIVEERGYVITNAHAVTDTAGSFIYEATSVEAKFYNSNEKYDLDIIAFDVERDIAVLKFRRNDITLSALEIGNSQNLSYGATVFTLGNAEGYGLSMTKGIISVPRRTFRDSQSGTSNEVIQVDAAVNSGSSGGPLLNIEGQVIGLISFKVKNNGASVEGIGFAIPSDIFIEFFYDNTDIEEGELEDVNNEIDDSIQQEQSENDD
ncbi:MAG: S1C family serine protease [Bacillota bacterium]